MAVNKTWTGAADSDWGVAGNWLPSGVPVITDHVRLTPDYDVAITAGLNQSGVALGDVIVEDGYTATLGSKTENLRIDPNRFEFAGSGLAYIDLGSAAIAARILATAAAASGLRGLYLIGSALTELSVEGGDVGLATRLGETATAATVRVLGAKSHVELGAGATVTNVDANAGTARILCALTTLEVLKATVTTQESGAIATVQLWGGNLHANSSGTIATLTVNGGVVDFLGSGISRTVSALQGNRGTVLFDPDVVTITARTAPDQPVRETYRVAN